MPLRQDAGFNPLLALSLCAALVPFLTVHAAYLLAASDGQVPWCFPYWDSCTSISATGRQPPAAFLFRAGMLPSAAVIMGFWWLHAAWLRGLGAPQRRCKVMLQLGLLACLGLILYVTVLGVDGSVWRMQRRVGTILFFSFTFLAQLLLAAQLRAAAPLSQRARELGRQMLRICLLMLVIGVGSVIVQLVNDSWHDEIEDAIEWQLALLLQLNFLLSARFWWRAEWQLQFHRARDNAARPNRKSAP